jgi:hypothetical protein
LKELYKLKTGDYSNEKWRSISFNE